MFAGRMFEPLTCDWADKKIAILGGGPSLMGYDFERLRNFHVVAINDAMLHVPWSQTAFTIDTVWLARRTAEIAAYTGEMVAAVPHDYASPQAGVRYLKRARVTGLSPKPDTIWTGENSGFAALGMSMMRGATRIAMLGYDLTRPGHFHAGYDWKTRFDHRCYRQWAQMFRALALEARDRNIRVINCNPASGVRCFPFGQPEDLA